MTTCRVRALIVLLLLLLPLPFIAVTTAAAHDIGDSRVIIAHDAVSWTALFTTAPTALINRLELLADRPPSRDLDEPKARSLLTAFQAELPAHFHIAIDGAPVPITVGIERLEFPTDVLRPAVLVLKVAGAMPENATSMTWQFDLLKSRYALQLAGRSYWLEGDEASPPLPFHPGPSETLPRLVVDYLQLGFTHILPGGPDHVLFVTGLVLLSTRLRPLITQITAFTVAHCLTLLLALQGVIALPGSVVEPLIALSISYVAAENILVRQMTPWRPLLVFGFGLMHGLGFAGVLTELGLPANYRLAAVIAFNLGVEAGQLAVVGLLFGLVLFWWKDKPWYRNRIVQPLSAAIALVGFTWTATRILGF
ncbi:hypothetical protein J2858_003926 [Neorhizobium galegae]|uniref:HupE/UreJ family protein n=1 Tax=Neorhizobium galegae TaxID=399 RepID=UPI001AEB5436|nr:HupE/UreJ family protein [Neorhizobium galegae]MBP2550986.1 hypothetical protein [Neorhizobium galegae]